MKKLLFLLLIPFSGAFAQAKFIEVEVRDTVVLKPSNFRCVITVTGDPEDDELTTYYNKPFDKKEDLKLIKKNLEKVERELKLRAYSYNPDEISINEQISEPSNGSITVNLVTSKQFDGLKGMLERFGFASMQLKNIQFLDGDKAETRLLKKIIDKAKVKADVIAAYSGLKLGRIMEVTESKETEDLSAIIKDVHLVTERVDDPMPARLSKALTVKFLAG